MIDFSANSISTIGCLASRSSCDSFCISFVNSLLKKFRCYEYGCYFANRLEPKRWFAWFSEFFSQWSMECWSNIFWISFHQCSRWLWCKFQMKYWISSTVLRVVQLFWTGVYISKHIARNIDQNRSTTLRKLDTGTVSIYWRLGVIGDLK